MSDLNTPQYLVDFLCNDPDETIGNATGMNPDGTVNVTDSNGNSINAIAATPCVSQTTLLERVNNTWYAFQSQNEVTSERVAINRRSKPQLQEASGLVKVLFYLLEGGVYNFYVGGDRPKPQKIYSSPTFPNAYFSNLGRGRNNWVAGFKDGLTVRNIFGQKTYTCAEPSLIWQGGGLWSYSLLGGITEVNYVRSTSGPDYSSQGWVIYETTESSSFISSVPSLRGGGGLSSYSKGGTRLDGNYDNPAPQPASSYEDRLSSFFENKTFSFYQNLKTYTTQSTNEGYNFSNTPAGGGDTSMGSTQTTTSLLEVVLSEKNLSVRKENARTFTQNENFVGSTGSNVGNVYTLDFSLLVSGGNTWVYKKTETNEPTDGSPPTAQRNFIVEHIVDGTVNTVANYVYQDQYPPALDSINHDLGATLKGQYFFFLPPSQSSTLYNKKLWTGKLKADYVNNIYDNPTLSSQSTIIPVWVARFRESSIEVLPDITTKFYSLPEQAKVIAASYCR